MFVLEQEFTIFHKNKIVKSIKIWVGKVKSGWRLEEIKFLDLLDLEFLIFFDIYHYKRCQYFLLIYKMLDFINLLKHHKYILWCKWRYFKTVKCWILSKVCWWWRWRYLEVEVFVRWQLSVCFNSSLFWDSLTLSCYLIYNYHIKSTPSVFSYHLTHLLGRFRDFCFLTFDKCTNNMFNTQWYFR